MQFRKELLSLAALSLTVGCAHRPLHSITAVDVPDSSFTDLKPGGSLQIIVPLLTAGSGRLETQSRQQQGGTIVLSAANLVGYEISHYSIQPRTRGRVQLRFTSATITKEKTTRETRAPALPFQLPSKAQHIRLIYLVRSSRTDHNMAIIAAGHLPDLDPFTATLKANPDACGRNAAIFCNWVPEGVAVRPD